MKLKDNVAIVTGGAGGIGKAVVRALLDDGAYVVIVEADELNYSTNQYYDKKIKGLTRAQELLKEFSDYRDRIDIINADVSKCSDVTRVIDEVIQKFKRIDILVNVAGVVTAGTIEELKEEDWDLIMDVNAKGTFLFCKYVLPVMKKQNYGRITNFASIAGRVGIPELSHYCASKFAVIGLTNALAKEVAKFDITINAVCPGIVNTQMWDLLSKKWAKKNEDIEESFKRNVGNMIPQGKPQTPTDMAKAVTFLISSEHITGQAIIVDGGATM